MYFIDLNRVRIEYSQDSVVGTRTMLWALKLWKSGSSLGKGKIFLSYKSPRPLAQLGETPVHRVSIDSKPHVMCIRLRSKSCTHCISWHCMEVINFTLWWTDLRQTVQQQNLLGRRFHRLDDCTWRMWERNI